jgi:hypothetical protein
VSVFRALSPGTSSGRVMFMHDAEVASIARATTNWNGQLGSGGAAFAMVASMMGVGIVTTVLRRHGSRARPCARVLLHLACACAAATMWMLHAAYKCHEIATSALIVAANSKAADPAPPPGSAIRSLRSDSNTIRPKSSIRDQRREGGAREPRAWRTALLSPICYPRVYSLTDDQSLHRAQLRG